MSTPGTKTGDRIVALQAQPPSLVAAKEAFSAPLLDGVPAFSTLDLELVVKDGIATLTLSEAKAAPGSPGVTGYGTGGVGGTATNFDQKPAYRPYAARGLGHNFGLYHQTYLDSAAYQRGVAKITEGLTTGYWSVKPVTCEDEETQQLADRQAKAVKAVLDGLEGGWSKHVREVLYGLLVPGFAPFIRVVDGFHQLRALSFRYPSQVARWITTENQADLIGVEFTNLSQDSTGNTYKVVAHDLLLYQFNAIGNNFEGISPLRGVLKFCKAFDLFVQIEAAAAEKFGAPVTFVERPVGQYDAVDDDRVVELLDAFVATDNAILLLPGGYKVTVASPVGQVPDFEPVKRYLDEQIALALTAEGSLVGMNGVGSYSMAEMKDTQALRTLAYYAKAICEVVNGTNVPYTGIIEHIVDHFADPLITEHFDGQLPKLEWSLSPEQDDDGAQVVDKVIAAKNAGMITWEPDDEVWLRTKLKMSARSEEAAEVIATAPQPEDAAPAVEPAAPDAAAAPDALDELIAEDGLTTTEAAAVIGTPVASTALNGAQIGSAQFIVESVVAGKMPARSGVELLLLAFPITEEQAARLLNLASVPAPGVEQLVVPEETP